MTDLTTTWPLLLARGVHLPVGWLTRGGWRLVEDEPDTGQVWWMDDGGVHRGPLPTSWASSAPDITDPATLGCLLAEVRRWSGDPEVHLVRFKTHVRPGGSGTDLVPARWWAIAHGSGEIMWFDNDDDEDDEDEFCLGGPTEDKALIAALCHFLEVGRRAVRHRRRP